MALAGSQGADGSNPLSASDNSGSRFSWRGRGVNGYTYEWRRRRFLND